eukprot:jgi/Mesen1/8237/ME000443S07384
MELCGTLPGVRASINLIHQPNHVVNVRLGFPSASLSSSASFLGLSKSHSKSLVTVSPDELRQRIKYSSSSARRGSCSKKLVTLRCSASSSEDPSAQLLGSKHPAKHPDHIAREDALKLTPSLSSSSKRAKVIAAASSGVAGKAQGGPPLEDSNTRDLTTTSTACILQAFSWTSPNGLGGKSWYKHLLENVDDMAACGFTDVLLPPCTQSDDQQGFLPRDFYDLNSAYGSSKELTSLIAALHEQGMHVCAEVAVNRYGTEQTGNGHVAWKQAGNTVDEDVDWTDWAANAGEGGDEGALEARQLSGSDAGDANAAAAANGDEYGVPAPIDHSDPVVQNDARSWLLWLKKDVGFDAWCFDYAKACDPLVVNIYARATAPAFVVGDVWNPMRYNGTALEYDQDQHRQELCNWVKATRGTAMGILQMAVERCEYWRLIDAYGRPPGMIGWWPSKVPPPSSPLNPNPKP